MLLSEHSTDIHSPLVRLGLLLRKGEQRARTGSWSAMIHPLHRKKNENHYSIETLNIHGSGHIAILACADLRPRELDQPSLQPRPHKYNLLKKE